MRADNDERWLVTFGRRGGWKKNGISARGGIDSVHKFPYIQQIETQTAGERNMTATYNVQHDAHLAEWLKARFNLTVSPSDYFGYDCWKGDYDLDIPTENGKTRFFAALEYAACYDGALFDKLNAIELGA